MSASNIGCDDEMDWIQINPQLFSSFPPDSRYLVGVSGGRDSIVLLHRPFCLGLSQTNRFAIWMINCVAENLHSLSRGTPEAYYGPSPQRPAGSTPSR